MKRTDSESFAFGYSLDQKLFRSLYEPFKDVVGETVLKSQKLNEDIILRNLASPGIEQIKASNNLILSAANNAMKAYNDPRAVSVIMSAATGAPRPDTIRLHASAQYLASMGIDPRNTAELRAFIGQTKGFETSGILSVLGIKKATYDEFDKQQEGLARTLSENPNFDHKNLTKNLIYNVYEKDEKTFVGLKSIVRSLKSDLATETGVRNVSGYYSSSIDNTLPILNINPIRAGLRNITKFATEELRIPILNINPAQMLGVKDFYAQSEAGEMLLSMSRASHPFVPKTAQAADMYTWHSTGGFLGTKGKLFAHKSTVDPNNPRRIKFETTGFDGFYRPLNMAVSSMFSRTAELAAGEKRAYSEGSDGLVAKAKRFLSFDEEQPNSLLRFIGRLKNRQADVNNPALLHKLMQVEMDEPFTIGGFGKKRNLKLTKGADDFAFDEGVIKKDPNIHVGRSGQIEFPTFQVVDVDTNEIVASHAELMEAFTRMAKKTLSYGVNKRIGKQFLLNDRIDLIDDQLLGQAQDVFGVNLSKEDLANRLLNPRSASDRDDILKLFKDDLALIKESHGKKDAIRAAEAAEIGENPALSQIYQPIAKAHSRIRRLGDIQDISQQSPMYEASSSIVTRADEISSEVVRYLIQRKALMQPRRDLGIKVVKDVAEIVDDLFERGVITAAQRSEAQAATLSTIYNISAFSTYRYSTPSSNLKNITDMSARFDFARNYLSQMGKDVSSSLVSPFTEGSSAIASGGVISTFVPGGKALKSFISKNLNMGGYVPDTSVSSLSGYSVGSQFTFMPTVATAIKANPKAALMSAAGIHTYDNAEGFSLGSVPISHTFQRLNRYFGSVGAGLKEDDFYGPLDLYFRGMNAKRILPAVAIGSTALAADRTIGGYTQPKDERGERVYSPLFLGAATRGAAEIHSAVAGLAPGGLTYRQKRDQLLYGEVPIRKGRFWPLGNTPFQGSKIEYYRPSYYRRMQGAPTHTSESFGSPIERLLYYNDFSPLRPLDPYRFERKHYEDRPYPITGEYFSGPFGAAVPILNATVGRVLKPQRAMHPIETSFGLSEYQRVGQSGAYLPPTGLSRPTSLNFGTPVNNINLSAAPAYYNPPRPLKHISASLNPNQFASNPIGNTAANAAISYFNQSNSSQAGSLNSARNATRANLSYYNQSLSSGSAVTPGGPGQISTSVMPGVPVGANIPPIDIVPIGLPSRTTDRDVIGGEIGYRFQETAGIYGFTAGNIRESLGFGRFDFEPTPAVLQSASKAYGSTRSFWDLNLGGLGDIPLQAEGPLGNIEFSEIVRRFIPKERNNIDYINPIKNRMGKQYSFLPGRDNFIDFTTGDPFVKVKEGEMRLPGVGYERFNKLYPDRTGRYGAVNQLDILADVAPYSKQFRTLNASIDKMGLSEEERAKVGQIRAQLNAIENSRTNFDSYYDDSLLGRAVNPIKTIRHINNPIINKFFGETSPTEEYERRNIYGATFPEWQRPAESFIKPIYYKSTNRNPILAAGIGAVAFSLFGRGPRGAQIFGTLGAVTVGGFSLFQRSKDKRFIPQERQKQFALEEYIDILSYVKNRTAASRAEKIGDFKSANQFMNLSKRTMYGADLNSKSIDQLAMSIPKRKRDYFKAMIKAPPSQRGRILSTAPRLERRIYEATWGMPVERRPDLNEYFTRHELPGPNWEGWHPNTNMDHVKIKTGQAMGLEMSQMGFYPQQIKEAQLTNPGYPEFNRSSGPPQRVRAKLQRLMFDMGISGDITEVANSSNPGEINVMAGVN